MRRFLIVTIFVVLLGGCSSNQEGNILPNDTSEDFNFVLYYGYGARNIINTSENSYTKNMIQLNDKTIELILSEEEKKMIYEEMKKADILNSVEKASEMQCADPHEENKLKLTVNGKVFEREWITSYCNHAADHKLKEFIWFVHREIIMERDEYKNLPEPMGGYD